jgi:hypothetical protein
MAYWSIFRHRPNDVIISFGPWWQNDLTICFVQDNRSNIDIGNKSIRGQLTTISLPPLSLFEFCKGKETNFFKISQLVQNDQKAKVVGSVTNVTILVTRSKNAIIALLSDLVNNGVTLSLGQDNVRLSYLAGPVISCWWWETHKLRNMKIWDENDIQ